PPHQHPFPTRRSSDLQRKTGKVKAHPGAAMLHVRLKRRSLGRIFGTRIEKHHDLVVRKKASVQIAPAGGRVKAELVLRRHFRKPSLGFPDKADMRRIFLGGIDAITLNFGLLALTPEQTKMSAAMPTALSAAMAL